MTHEELLEKFTDYEAHFDQVRDEEKLYRMLRAVVELHKPEFRLQINQGADGSYLGNEIKFPVENPNCLDCKQPYPCSIIQAIEKELG